MPLTRTCKRSAFALAALLFSSAACTPAPRAVSSQAAPANADVSTASAPPAPLDFDGYMRAEFAPADGFDFPFGDGEGGGDTDLGQPVYAVANGRVVFAQSCGRLWGNVVVIEHLFYENDERRELRSLYAHLNEIKVSEGQEVRRRQLIATVGQDPEKLFDAHLYFELRRDPSLAPTYCPSTEGKDAARMREQDEDPSSFIKSHRRLPVPQNESTLVLVDQTRYKARLYVSGRVAGEYNISLGQGVGEKQTQGDNRTPKGMYFVVQRHRGDFPGAYGTYYGGHWIKINYPNRYDAARGRAAGLITPAQESSIASAWERRAPTLETTRLGGGIGFHGWAREWPDTGPRHLSWGCVVLHLSDITQFYDQLPEGSMVVIF